MKTYLAWIERREIRDRMTIDKNSAYLMSLGLWVRRVFELLAGKDKASVKRANEVLKRTKMSDMVLDFSSPSSSSEKSGSATSPGTTKRLTPEEDKANKVALAKARWGHMISRNSRGKAKVVNGRVVKAENKRT